MSKTNPIISLEVTTHRDYINAVVNRERGSRHHSSITQASRLRLTRAQQRIIEATAPDELKPYSFGYEYGTKKVVRWTTGALAADPVALCEYDDCDQAALSGGDFCAVHQAEHDELMASEEPETTTELRQLITTELEAEQHWTAEEIMRREG